jgi:hypothetical protein
MPPPPSCDVCGCQIPPEQKPSALWRVCRDGSIEVECAACEDFFDTKPEETDHV